MGDISKGIDKNTVAALATTFFYMYGTDANTTKKHIYFSRLRLKFSHILESTFKNSSLWGKKFFKEIVKDQAVKKTGKILK
jgi:hypothetical protein